MTVPPHHSPNNGPASKTKICRYYLSRNNNHFGKVRGIFVLMGK
jgi:hypothetical protein